MTSFTSVIVCCLAAILGSAGAQSVTCRIDLAVLVDVSGSIVKNGDNMQNWYDMTNFTKNIVNTFQTDTVDSHVALITFGNNEKVYNYLTGNKTEIMKSVTDLASMIPMQNTNTSSALYVTLNNVFTKSGNDKVGDRPGVPDVIILITDGEPTWGLGGKTTDQGLTQQIKDEVRSLANQLKSRSTVIITVGVTDQTDKNLLRDIASFNSSYLEVLDFNKLEENLQPLIQSTCEAITTPKPTEPPKECRQHADIYFILDSSGSIGEIKFKAVRQYVADVIRQLPVGFGTRVGVLYYSQNQLVGFHLSDYDNSVTAAEATMKIPFMRSTTNTADSLKYMREQAFTAANGNRSGIPDIAVIFTDGNSNVGAQQTLQEAYLAKAAGIHIISVGLGTWINQYELQSIASDPYSKNYIQVDDVNTFSNQATVMNLKALLCNDVNECATVTCQCGGTCMDKIGSFRCICPGSCAGEYCERGCTQRTDVIFAVDSSSSLQAKDFRAELDFIRNAVVGLNMVRGDRVGLIRFSTAPFIRFHLKDFTSVDSVLNALTLDFNGGETNTELALREVRTNMFTSANGDTAANINVLVILTDGKSKSMTSTWAEARLLREAGVNIITIGIGDSVRLPELQALASGPDNTNVYQVSAFTALSTVSNNVINAICNTVGECEAIRCQNGGVPKDYIGYCECQCPAPSGSTQSFSGPFCERRCSGKVDIVLIIDSSGSIRNERMLDVLQFIADFVKQYPLGDNGARYGAIYFSDTAVKAFDLNTYKLQEDIIIAIKSIPFMGQRTNIADALAIANGGMFSTGSGGRNDAAKFVVIFTDGKSNVKPELTIPNAISLRENTAKIMVIGIGADADTLELRGMASEPVDSMMMMAPSFKAITQIGAMRTNLTNQLVLGPCQSTNLCGSNPCVRGTCFNDYHQYVCQCPIQYGGRNCERVCRVQLDVALVLDFSASLDMVYRTVIAFAKEMVYGLPAPTDVRIAVVDYDDVARLHFHLNKYTTNKEFIINALSFSEKGTRTNTQAALDLLTTHVFTAANGDRSGVKNVAVVVTDGGSNIQQAQTVAKAQQARNAGIELFVAAYGNYQMSEINDIANDPDSSHVVQIGINNDVKSAASRMLDLLCVL